MSTPMMWYFELHEIPWLDLSNPTWSISTSWNSPNRLILMSFLFDKTFQVFILLFKSWLAVGQKWWFWEKRGNRNAKLGRILCETALDRILARAVQSSSWSCGVFNWSIWSGKRFYRKWRFCHFNGLLRLAKSSTGTVSHAPKALYTSNQ